MKSLIEWFGGRRFVMTMGCGVACTVLVWFGRITPEVFAAIIIATVAAYITGNTTQHALAGRGRVDGQDPV